MAQYLSLQKILLNRYLHYKNENLLFKVTMTNKVIRAKSRCATCMAKKTRFLKQKHNKKSG